MKKVIFLMLAVFFLAACNNATQSDQTATEPTEEPSSDTKAIEVAVIDVTGMHCDGCVNTITKALQDIDGVSEVKVSLEYEQAKVKFSPSKVKEEDFNAAIEGKGYGVASIEIKKTGDQAPSSGE